MTQTLCLHYTFYTTKTNSGEPECSIPVVCTCYQEQPLTGADHSKKITAEHLPTMHTRTVSGTVLRIFYTFLNNTRSGQSSKHI